MRELGCLKKGVRKILHDIVIVGSIQSDGMACKLVYFVHLIIKSELVYKVC